MKVKLSILFIVCILEIFISTQSNAQGANTSGYNRELYVDPSDPAATDGNNNNCLQIPCRTLTRALVIAGNGDAIYLSPGTYRGPFVIRKSIDLIRESGFSGSGQVVIDSYNKGRVFEITGTKPGSITVGLIGITVQNGTAPTGTQGGGILVNNANLNFSNGSVLNNTAPEAGGIQLLNGTLKVTDSVFENNSSTSYNAGAIHAIGSNIVVEVTRTRFTNNRARRNGAAIKIKGDEATKALASLTVTDSVFTNNFAGEEGGGINIDLTRAFINQTQIANNTVDSNGGAITVLDSYLTLNNSTLSGNKVNGTNSSSNRAGLGGGIYARLSSGMAASVIVQQSTISGNEAREGAGIYSVVPTSVYSSTIAYNIGQGFRTSNQLSSATQVQNTIIAKNTVAGCAGPLNSLGFNLDEDGSCGLARTGDIVGDDPKLLPLGMQGGLTPVHAIGSCSPALDKGDPQCKGHQGVAFCSPYSPNSVQCKSLNNDQRGKGFSRYSNGSGAVGPCDIGAFEMNTALACTD